jgi:hypothetical protein
MKTDSMLQQDVIDELLYEPGPDASNIGVVANGGVIRRPTLCRGTTFRLKMRVRPTSAPSADARD